MTQTAYKILIRDEHGHWQEFDTVTASSTESAIRHAVTEDGAVHRTAGPQAGEFVAIPTRSWKPTTVRVQAIQQIRLGEEGSPDVSTTT